MKLNTSSIDRIIRVGLALAAAGITGFVALPTIAAYSLYAFAAILVLTAAVGFCPIYALLGIKTAPDVKS